MKNTSRERIKVVLAMMELAERSTWGRSIKFERDGTTWLHGRVMRWVVDLGTQNNTGGVIISRGNCFRTNGSTDYRREFLSLGNLELWLLGTPVFTRSGSLRSPISKQLPWVDPPVGRLRGVNGPVFRWCTMSGRRSQWGALFPTLLFV